MIKYTTFKYSILIYALQYFSPVIYNIYYPGSIKIEHPLSHSLTHGWTGKYLMISFLANS